jgi:hypothetical protein
MKSILSNVRATLVVALLLSSSAHAQQWILDGQRVQTLEIHVSDPQALYTDGSRQMTAPLPVASSVTATSGMLRASIPWAYDHEVHDFFMISEPDQAVVLSSSGEIDLKIGKLFVRESGIYQTDEGTTINMEEHMLSGGWQIDEVLPYPEAIISRGFADGKYMIAGAPSTQSLTFAQSLTATNGALQIYAKDSEEHHGYFKTLSFQDGLQFSTTQSDALLFGTPTDGLLVSPNTLMHLGYNTTIDFETGNLTGPAGAKWHVTENPTEPLGIVNKGYADGRYLLRTTGITTNRVIQAGNTLVISNGLITAILP